MEMHLFVMVLSCVRGYIVSSPGPTWDVRRCSNINPIEDGRTIFLSAGGKWSQDKFCMGIRADLKVSDDTAYVMTVNFNNVRGSKYCKVMCGHPGFAFNYWDEDNFDFVYKRVHSNTFAYGKVNGGIIQFTSGSVGGNPTIVSGSWYNLKIEVDENKNVNLYLSGKKLGSFKAFFSTRGYGGVIVGTGYKNDVMFRDYDVSPKIKKL
jgi:hypothetical protein